MGQSEIPKWPSGLEEEKFGQKDMTSHFCIQFIKVSSATFQHLCFNVFSPGDFIVA
jgi:hypothetical protein